MTLIKVWVADALVNGCEQCVDGDYLKDTLPAEAYARGIVNGIVSMLTAQGYVFVEALAFVQLIVRQHINQGSMPHGCFSPNAIPTAWRDDWDMLWQESNMQLEARMARVPKLVRVS